MRRDENDKDDDGGDDDDYFVCMCVLMMYMHIDIFVFRFRVMCEHRRVWRVQYEVPLFDATLAHKDMMCFQISLY